LRSGERRNAPRRGGPPKPRWGVVRDSRLAGAFWTCAVPGTLSDVVC